ncbi:DUF3857 domain-containing protein [Mucilaginibacter sp. RS28]|uniref:DUF3857 domain-containing protein n=1 Tax=Mucilaginibacter straminoryzae TaxID=2932774 RepID=A0A9X1X731_9SPHI|nr:DUF3857 domain-containing protein [Mucilaginibacter straminoryzae]MCJ8209839.1 DUF3857 domain-containing protein [Mucilaginibacter straminoryzae]
MKRISYLTILFSLLLSATYASDFPFAAVANDALQQKKYLPDTGAHAVVLDEFGKTFISDDGNHMVMYYEYHVKIKLFDSQAFDAEGNIEIPLYKEDGERFETVRDIKAVTMFLDENGGLQTLELDPRKVFQTSVNKYHDVAKFAMPGLRKGCVIEYKYTVVSPFIFNFHDWIFQSDIPKVHSEYNARIPAIYNYNAILRGPLKLSTNKAELDRECLSVNGIKCDCSNMTYGIDNIPAFKREDYMTASKNFLSGIYFELSEYTNLSNGVRVKVTKDWQDIDRSLKGSEFFGSQIKRKELMRERIKDVIAGKTNNLDKAKAVYAFIQKNIKWNGFYSKYSEDGIKKALDTHSGLVGDINLALIAALKAADIPTDAVLLSTREHGLVNKLYPTESDFDYVIAKTTIDNKDYLLDATDPLLGFGMLPMRCINDQGRVISFEKPSYWMDIKSPQRRNKTTTLELSLMPNGKLKGTYTCYSLGYEGYEKRKEIKKFNTLDEYIENLDEKSTKIKILKSSVSNLDTLDAPLAEIYEIEIEPTRGTGMQRLSFSPFTFGQLTVNPFTLNERSYPVDMGMPADNKLVYTLTIPNDYVLETSPEPVAVALPLSCGRLVSAFTFDSGRCTYSQLYSFEKPVYSPEEYPYLKEFYNKLLQSEKAEIVIKKK